ncbi:hypothetical protein LSG31_04515 [Fodinisporobacter ferrooxydans]|uniref:Uncharacterized protein n=1 Tax=Fodinisporobacter ferrooxydans TaxID=2901836 RepID=A0ABY4CQL2_9BACL|nr:hypothetical protein LSG31_04515 [Alicyclobacillaceae bacterium MYW30-H2]
MGRGQSLFRSIKLETPEIERDVKRISCVLPFYKDGVGNITKVLYTDGTLEERLYSTDFWSSRFTKFHGESSHKMSWFSEHLGKYRNIPIPVGATILLPLKMRCRERVRGDGTIGYFMMDTITQVIKSVYMQTLDAGYFDEYPDAKCAILLLDRFLVPCFQAYQKVMASMNDGLAIQKLLQDSRQEIAASRPLGRERDTRFRFDPGGFCAEGSAPYAGDLIKIPLPK